MFRKVRILRRKNSKKTPLDKFKLHYEEVGEVPKVRVKRDKNSNKRTGNSGRKKQAKTNGRAIRRKKR